MDELLERLKHRILPATAPDEQLNEMLKSATALYLRLRYPYSPYPTVEIDNGEGNITVEPATSDYENDWILRAAVEMFSRIGAEGQLAHSENSISRTFDSGTVSASLRNEVRPVCVSVR